MKFRGDDLFITCRDQLARLRDLNGDGETDFFECFNNDHQVTEHFHEFAMGLQTDAAGNFYYAKSGRHALDPVVPHHGTLLRVSADGSRTDILATGFRAANGVCLNEDGTFFVTDQEGFWTPKNRINRVKTGGFYGNMFGYTDVTDTPTPRWSRRWSGSPTTRTAALRNCSGCRRDAWGIARRFAAQSQLRHRPIFHRAARGGRRHLAGRGVRAADAGFRHRHHARPLRHRWRALHLRHVRVGGQCHRAWGLSPDPPQRTACHVPLAIHAAQGAMTRELQRSARSCERDSPMLSR